MTTTNYVLTGSDGVQRFYEYFTDLLEDLNYLGFTDYEVEVQHRTFDAAPEPMKTVKNLMSGIDIEIPVDTPRSCDPSSELYWSM
jgi:hypothetical protein